MGTSCNTALRIQFSLRSSPSCNVVEWKRLPDELSGELSVSLFLTCSQKMILTFLNGRKRGTNRPVLYIILTGLRNILTLNDSLSLLLVQVGIIYPEMTLFYSTQCPPYSSQHDPPLWDIVLHVSV